MLGNKERWQLHAQETLGCPAAAAAAVPLTPIKRSRAARGAGPPGSACAPADPQLSAAACSSFKSKEIGLRRAPAVGGRQTV